VGTISPRSILQPTRYLTRHKKRTVSVIEAETTEVDVRLTLSLLTYHLTAEIAREEDCNVHRYVPANFNRRLMTQSVPIAFVQIIPAFTAKYPRQHYLMITLYTLLVRKPRRLVYPELRSMRVS
jgi:hypothetical protein